MSSRRRRNALAVLVLAGCTAGVGGCVTVGGTIASSVVSAALKTAIEQAERNRPTPEELWHDAQLASLEQRAISGELEAQYQLGTYYLAIQEPAAADWICNAANQGHASAQLQYGHFFNEDRTREDLFHFVPIRPDNVEAYVWYSLAARHGEPRAGHFRDSLTSGAMSVDKLDRAEIELAGWTPVDCARLHAASTVVAGGHLAAQR